MCNVVVTGSAGDPTASGTQSETAATEALIMPVGARIVVAYNDETNDQNFITYTEAGRTVNSGASLMGWSYSDDSGSTWTYGGKLKPPKDWSVLWGDPALGTSKTQQNVVFMSNLAVPAAKFPGPIDGPLNDFIGGACLAKSTDSGKTFNIWQCVSNTDPLTDSDGSKGHFYDGGSIVGSSTGEMFAAWVDVDNWQIDVYRAPNENGTFTRIAPPFPGMHIGAHPRLRTAPDGSLYVAAQRRIFDSSTNTDRSYVFMNRYANGSWQYAVQVSSELVFYVDIDFGTTVQGSQLVLRTGSQLSFDIGAASAEGSDAIRLVYQRQSATTKQLFIAVAVCSLDLVTCHDAWSTEGDAGPGNNLIDFYNGEVVAWPGSVSIPATWQATWAFRYGKTNTVNVSRSVLGYFNGTPLLLPVDIIKQTPVCPDTRGGNGGGYWGDYDAMVRTGLAKSIWLRFLTDSSQGCTKRWWYTAESQHVQLAHYDY
jgi:hypothetical protein